MERIPVLSLAAALLLAASASANPDEVRLKDGRVLVGQLVQKRDGSTLEITTRLGVVEVDRDQVVSIRTDDELREELAGLERSSRPSPFRDFHLAKTAFGYGLTDEMWGYLDQAYDERALRSGRGIDAALRQRMGEFLATLEPELLPPRWRQADTETRVQELLYRVRPKVTAGRRAAILELLTREPDADEALRQRARRATSHIQRITALEALSRRAETPGNDEFVYRTAILDMRREVRSAATDLVRRQGDSTAAVQYLAPGLMHPAPLVRMRTAEAFAGMGDRAAVPLLVAAGPNAGKALAGSDPSVRGHIAIIQQESYMRDFDVEVASSSFIADPQVDVIQSGVVLDTTVHAVTLQRTEIVRVYRSALKSLVGTDPGSRASRWGDWWSKVEAETKADAVTTAKRGKASGEGDR